MLHDGTLRRSRIWLIGALVACASCLLLAGNASASTETVSAPGAGGCPPIANKPGQIHHINYKGIEHITYCDGPITVQPGQNIIRLNPSNLFPQVPGYITRFDPDLVYTDGTVPRVDILHLHHAVWVVNGNPQFAVGEEKTIQQLPKGFGWRSKPTDSWFVNDMLHNLTPEPAQVYIVWRIDFVPDTSPAAATMHTVQTHWMSVAGPDTPDLPGLQRAQGHGRGRQVHVPRPGDA